MPSKKGVKRSMAAPAVEPKRAKSDPLVTGVVDALRQADDLPEDCRAMLAACVPGSLGTPAAERHHSQALLVSIIGEIIEGLRSKLQAALDAADAEQASRDRQKVSLEGTVMNAKAAVSGEDAKVADKQAELDNATQALAAAEANVVETQEAQKLGNATLLEVAKEKKMLEANLDKEFGYLMQEEGFESSQADLRLEALLPVAKNLRLDDSFLAAMPASCAKPPNARGDFDCMVLARLQASLREKIAALATELEDGCESEERHARAVTAAEGAVNAAEETQKAAAMAVDAAKVQQQQAVQVLSAAETMLEDFVQGGSLQAAARKEKAAALTEFNYNVECFETLRDRAVSAGA